MPTTYQLQEGSIQLPPQLQDRSINTFIHFDNGKIVFNLSISRDTPKAGEDIGAYFLRQIALLQQNMPGYKLNARAPVLLGSGAQALTGEQLDAKYKSGQQIVYQRQAAFFLTPQQALIFSATAAQPFAEEFDGMWQNYLASFVAKPA